MASKVGDVTVFVESYSVDRQRFAARRSPICSQTMTCIVMMRDFCVSLRPSLSSVLRCLLAASKTRAVWRASSAPCLFVYASSGQRVVWRFRLGRWGSMLFCADEERASFRRNHEGSVPESRPVANPESTSETVSSSRTPRSDMLKSASPPRCPFPSSKLGSKTLR